MKPYLLFLMLLAHVFIFSQNKITAKLVNENTNEPIEFASILNLSTFEGTITDTLGIFELVYENENQRLMIQSLGYVTDTFSIKEILESKTIFLKVNNFEISEIVVYPKNAFEIMRKAVAKIPENYYSKTIAQNVFYRQEIIANNEILSLEEANFDALVKFKNKNTNLITVKKSRAIIDLDTLKSLGKMVEKQLEGFDSINIRENASQFFAMNFMLSDEIGEDSKELFGVKGYKNYDYNYNGMVEKDGYYAYHITFDQVDNVKKSLFKGHFYIDTASLAFIDIHLFLSPKGLAYQKVIPKSVMFIINILGYKVYIKGMDFNVHYKKLDGKWVMQKGDSKFAAKVSKKNGGSFDGYMKIVFDVNKFYLKEGFYNKRNKYDKIPSNKVDFHDSSFWGNLDYLPLSRYEQRLIDVKKN